MNKLHIANSGFTLLEILISITVLAVMGVLLTQVFVTVIRTNIKNEILKEVKQNGDLSNAVMTRIIQNAQEVTSDCAPGGSTGPSITLANPDSGVTTFECVKDASNSGILRISSTSGTPNYLTSPAVTLVGTDCTTAFIVTCNLLPSNDKSVTITFSLAQPNASAAKIDTATENFTSTVTMRNK